MDSFRYFGQAVILLVGRLRKATVERPRLSLFYRCLSVMLAYMMLISPSMLEELTQADIQYSQLTTATWGEDGKIITYAYDDNGSLQTKITTVGGITPETAEQVVNEYNLQGHLAKITTTPYIDGVAQTAIVTEYKYDPDGNRVAKIVDGVTTDYLIDNYNLTGYSQVFVEKTGANKTVYVMGDDILAQATGSAQTDIQYLLYDGHGSTRQLTNTSGTVITGESYSYDAYGVMLGGERTTATNLLYTGEQWDSSAQMYYLRARYYDPMNGRFNQVDPYAGNNQDPQSLHKYLYTHDNPVNNVDPSGRDIVSITIVVIMSVIALLAIGLNIYRAIRDRGQTRCGACGPDVTEPLMHFKYQVTHDFNRLTPTGKIFKCWGMWGTNRWDITELKGTLSYPGCGTGSCEDTVQVSGKCYSKESVNYYLWGIMNSLCNPFSGRSTDAGLQWTVLSGDFLCKREWARAGLTGNIGNVYCPEYGQCRTGCPHRIISDFNYHWYSGVPVFWSW